MMTEWNIGARKMCFIHKWIKLSTKEETHIIKRQKFAIRQAHGIVTTVQCAKCGKEEESWTKNYGSESWIPIPNPETHHTKFPPEK